MPSCSARKSINIVLICAFAIAVFYEIRLLFKLSSHNKQRFQEDFPRRDECDTIQNLTRIPVLVFTCNREKATEEHIRKLLRLRPDPCKFPIFVSQECDNFEVADTAKSFGDIISYRKFPTNSSHGRRYKKNLRAYSAIARHYKLGLDWVFENPRFSAVLITEDDLDVSDDFFSYFTAMLPLLQNDSSLFCVSAWNDNGQEGNIDTSAHTLFYRTDYFPGLGWMTTRKIWEELSPIWPDVFWDDWLRRNENRKGRQCIRPEIGRTSMTPHGAKGASGGQFFKKHIKAVVQIDKKVNYDDVDLEILKPDLYKKAFDAEIRRAKPVTLEQLNNLENYSIRPVKIMFDSPSNFSIIAKRLKLMSDFRADGVARLSYQSVVTAFQKGVRIYLVPRNYTYHQ